MLVLLIGAEPVVPIIAISSIFTRLSCFADTSTAAAH